MRIHNLPIGSNFKSDLSLRIFGLKANSAGDPPALPGWQQEFDIFSSWLHPSPFRFCQLAQTWQGEDFGFDRLRSGPFEGPAPVKPPALPEATYSLVFNNNASEPCGHLISPRLVPSARTANTNDTFLPTSISIVK